jgi:hypothetical protein
MNFGCYCSLVISREVFFVSEGHRKPILREFMRLA